MWMGQRRKELDVHLDGKRHKHTQFCIIGGAVCGDDNSDTEMFKRITASERSDYQACGEATALTW